MQQLSTGKQELLHISTIINAFNYSYFKIVSPQESRKWTSPYPPPLSGLSAKKNTFFAASLREDGTKSQWGCPNLQTLFPLPTQRGTGICTFSLFIFSYFFYNLHLFFLPEFNINCKSSFIKLQLNYKNSKIIVLQFFFWIK